MSSTKKNEGKLRNGVGGGGDRRAATTMLLLHVFKRERVGKWAAAAAALARSRDVATVRLNT